MICFMLMFPHISQTTKEPNSMEETDSFSLENDSIQPVMKFYMILEALRFIILFTRA